jgi:hypothetical protein
MSSLIISQLSLQLMKTPLQLLDLSLMVCNLSAESILLSGISGLQFFQFLPIGFPEPSYLLKQMSDFSILECNLGVEYF